MKSLKFDHDAAQQILNGEKKTTWRIYDDKDLSVNDRVIIIDKVNPKKRDSWKAIGLATIDQVFEKRLADIDVTKLQEVQIEKHEDFVKRARQYYGEDVREDVPVKIAHFTFEPQSEKTLLDEEVAPITTSNTEVKLFADGGSRGNPGPSASGFVLYTMNDETIEEGSLYLGITTNNQAEYKALRLGLEQAKAYGANIVHVFMDSLLVINQMKDQFKVRNQDLWPIHQSIKQLIREFQEVDFTHVPRELNKHADAMVNQSLDEAVKHK